jgi:hypothetical protein
MIIAVVDSFDPIADGHLSVVVVFPVADSHAGLDQRPEAVDVEAFGSDAGAKVK